VGKKLKIIAKITKNQDQASGVTVPSHHVEYQWRWVRVFAASLMCVVLPVSAVIYFYPSDMASLENRQAIETVSDAEQKTDQIESHSQTKEMEAVVSIESQPVITADTKVQKETQSSMPEVEPLPEKAVAEPKETEVVETEILETEVVETEIVEAKVLEAEIAETSEPVTNSTTQAPEKSEKEYASTLYDTAMGVKIDTQYVSRALLTRDIQAREPVDIINKQIDRSSFTKKLFFFTEVHKLNNQTVHHKWYFDDQLQADVALSIYANRYRTYSSKNISALQQGLWRVELIANGKILASKQFTVTGR
jgi:hypothetical protein